MIGDFFNALPGGRNFKTPKKLKAMNYPEQSKDYERLYSLISMGFRVPCYVDSRDGYRPIAEVKAIETIDKGYSIGSQGISYNRHFYSDSKADFLHDCEVLKLGWIDNFPPSLTP